MTLIRFEIKQEPEAIVKSFSQYILSLTGLGFLLSFIIYKNFNFNFIYRNYIN